MWHLRCRASIVIRTPFLGLSESKILAIAPVLLVGDQVVRVTLFKTADVTAILNQHGGVRQHCIEGRQINVLIKDPNVEERFVRVFDYPANANMEVMKVRLREFGTVLDLRRDRYAGATAGMIPCLTGQLTVRMTLNSPIHSYLQVGEHKVYIRYANQPVTCRECNLPGHMALECPARKNRLLPAPPKIVPQKTNGGKEKSMAAALQSASRPPSTPTEFPPLPDRSWTEVSRRKKNQNKTEGDETVLVPETPPIIVLPSAESSTEIVVESQDIETLSAEPTPTGEVLRDLAREHGRTDMSASEFEEDMSAIETSSSSVPASPKRRRTRPRKQTKTQN
ncbi:hypothetical protein DAPPUDRAFT_115036 [Daphnia pulex]|uniref:CCHC-type domain-containing protein n=1 Tax=Daphnia pulex TaxID=6669 RepID=E9HK01_DAPPU|nr:hypothetical protein DAPPUDRAFT_115036 [Daphnia pulex]|eukprot:EFX67906.1 hypothetical protein DAPPUDRAFT_115036 [Daphnia pulex]